MAKQPFGEIVPLLGLSSAGKDTLVNNLIPRLWARGITTGSVNVASLLRQAGLVPPEVVEDDGSQHGVKVYEPYTMIDTQTVTELIATHVSDDQPLTRLILLNGYPRTVDQVEGLALVAAKVGRQVAGVLELVVDDDEATRRMCRRHPDKHGRRHTDQEIADRIAYYREHSGAIKDALTEPNKFGEGVLHVCTINTTIRPKEDTADIAMLELDMMLS